MRQTLFFIPDTLAGVPLFGFGLLLLLWLVGASICLWMQVKRQGWTDDTKSFVPFLGLVAVAFAFILPMVQVEIQLHERAFMLWNSDSTQGLPIRGYGVFLLIATISGLGLAMYRGRQVGLSSDAIFNLAFHMFVGGIVGARLFYIIQYWDEIYVPGSLQRTVGNMFNFVEGGLVVYGSLIGALVAAFWFLRKHRLPLLAVADLIAPSLALGLAIGRIGCLMNGCCYGGTCDHAWAITFPQQSPPYFDQHRSGEFFGFRMAPNQEDYPVITEVAEGSSAAAAGLRPDQIIEEVFGTPINTFLEAQRLIAESAGGEIDLTADGTTFNFSTAPLPERSKPVHPTQIYSSINAAVLCLLTWALFPYRRRDGEVFVTLLGLYAVTRFLLEVIRTDEGSLWSTGLTISQNVSVAMMVGVALLAAYLARQPLGSVWPSASPKIAADAQ